MRRILAGGGGREVEKSMGPQKGRENSSALEVCPSWG